MQYNNRERYVVGDNQCTYRKTSNYALGRSIVSDGVDGGRVLGGGRSFRGGGGGGGVVLEGALY